MTGPRYMRLLLAAYAVAILACCVGGWAAALVVMCSR